MNGVGHCQYRTPHREWDRQCHLPNGHVRAHCYMHPIGQMPPLGTPCVWHIGAKNIWPPGPWPFQRTATKRRGR